MGIREEVHALISMGRLPSEEAVVATPELDGRIEQMQQAIELIVPPVTREEAEKLLGIFGPDSSFGLAWSVVHLIESAPGGTPLVSAPPPDANYWVRFLWDRARRAEGVVGARDPV